MCQSLKQTVDYQRQLLQRRINNQRDLADHNTLKMSQKLDKLIVKYMRAQQQDKKCD
ncbi:MAG: aspartyl-phosphate phosphatase Spo0E family protein [Bacillota bacterium]